MGNVISILEARRSRPLRDRVRPPDHIGTIALFIGVRIEHWGEPRPETFDDTPQQGPATPGRRRRRRG